MATDERKTVEFDHEARWFRDLSGRLVLLEGKRVMRRLVLALLRRHLEAPREVMTPRALFEAAWPADPTASEAAVRSRVYMTLCRLRQFGLAGVIVHLGGGYRLSPYVVAVVRGTP